MVPDVNDRAQVGQKLVEAGRHNGSFSEATSKEGNALCMGPQPGVEISESPFQEILLKQNKSLWLSVAFYIAKLQH